MAKETNSTSWHQIGKWYDEAVGEQGHYYHQHIIIPNLLKILNFDNKHKQSLLDLACGQGILSRHIPAFVRYTGVDAAKSLIAAAKKYAKRENIEFHLFDVTKPITLEKNSYSHATIILAIQNIEFPLLAFKNAFDLLQKGGKLVIVLNHPCFRIPRQSSWKIDEAQKIQYRRIDKYMSAMKIPIQTHPGKGGKSPESWSFHHPLSSYTKWLNEAGFKISGIEEWCSDKVSEGKNAKMENRARDEFPLFMTIIAEKS